MTDRNDNNFETGIVFSYQLIILVYFLCRMQSRSCTVHWLYLVTSNMMTSRLIEWQLSSMKVKYNQYRFHDSSVCGVLPVWLLHTYYNKSNMLVTWHLVTFVTYSIYKSVVTNPPHALKSMIEKRKFKDIFYLSKKYN